VQRKKEREREREREREKVDGEIKFLIEWKIAHTLS
jgi:hypothetical protein